MIVRELITKLGFNLDDRGLKKAEAGIKTLKATTLALTGALIAGGAAILATVKSAADFGDNLLKTSQKLGVSVEALQKLQYAAGLADVSAEQLSMGIGLLAKNLNEAKNGSKEATESFQKLLGKGFSPKNLKDPEQALLLIADRFKALPDGIEKTATAMKLFGKSGKEMIPFLNAGSEGIRAMGKEIEDLGLIFGTDAAEAGEAFNDQLFRLKYISSTLVKIVGAKLIPIFMRAVTAFLEWVKANREIIKTNLTGFMNGMVSVFETLWDITKILGRGFKWFADKVGGVSNAIKILAGGAALGLLIKVGLALAALIGGIPALIVGAVAAVGAAIYLIYDDVVAFMEGRPSFFEPVYEKMIPIIEAIKSGWQQVVSFVQDAVLVFNNDILPVLQFLGKVAWDVFNFQIVEPLKLIINTLKTVYMWFYNINKAIQDFIGSFGFVQKAGDFLKGALINSIPGVAAFKAIKGRAGQIREGLGNAQSNADSIVNAPAAAGNVTAGDSTQNNDFQVNQKIEINVQSGADPAQIGEEVRKQTKAEMDKTFRVAMRALQPGTVA